MIKENPCWILGESRVTFALLDRVPSYDSSAHQQADFSLATGDIPAAFRATD